MATMTGVMKVRESNYELLRIVAMFFIVLYHILYFFIAPVDDSPLYRAMYLPLHVGVVCFVLISGYFHIKPSLKGIVKLILPLLVFYLPLSVYEILIGTGGGKSLLFFSQSPYWFIRTYFYLFLIAPILNSFITSNNRRLYLLIALGFISIYMGTMQESSLKDGKNLILFMFLYVLGDSIKANSEALMKIKTASLVSIYLFLNILVVSTFVYTENTTLGKAIWYISYPYCSPILILNGVLLFLIFERMKFRSRIINFLASSVFAVYILHHQHYILYFVIGPLALKIYSCFHTPLYVLLGLCLFTILILIVCIIIDKLFSPLWRYFDKKAGREDLRINMLFKSINGR